GGWAGEAQRAEAPPELEPDEHAGHRPRTRRARQPTRPPRLEPPRGPGHRHRAEVGGPLPVARMAWALVLAHLRRRHRRIGRAEPAEKPDAARYQDLRPGPQARRKTLPAGSAQYPADTGHRRRDGGTGRAD